MFYVLRAWMWELRTRLEDWCANTVTDAFVDVDHTTPALWRPVD